MGGQDQLNSSPFTKLGGPIQLVLNPSVLSPLVPVIALPQGPGHWVGQARTLAWRKTLKIGEGV